MVCGWLMIARGVCMFQPEGEDELKKLQLMELAIMNGTFRDNKQLISMQCKYEQHTNPFLPSPLVPPPCSLNNSPISSEPPAGHNALCVMIMRSICVIGLPCRTKGKMI
jgi:hypothetical protein